MSVGSVGQYNAFGKIVKQMEAPRPIDNQSIEKGKGDRSFQDVMGEVVKEVQEARVESNDLIENLMTGEKPVAVHEAMIALQKADVAFQLMNRVRTKLVRAYEEIMRTPV